MHKPAEWHLLLPRDPEHDDQLYLTISCEGAKLRLLYFDSKNGTAEGMLNLALSLLPRCHLEYETHKASEQIDTDLDKLFGDGDDDA